MVTCDMLRGKSEDYVVKDLCIYNLTSQAIQNFGFKSPYPESELSQRTISINAYISKHIHGVKWNYGHIDYSELEKIFRTYVKQTDLVYVKGVEMVRVLKTLIPDCYVTVKNMESEMWILSEDIRKKVVKSQPTVCTLDKKYRCLTRALKWGAVVYRMFQYQKGTLTLEQIYECINRGKFFNLFIIENQCLQ
jgi:hypothetical protein